MPFGGRPSAACQPCRKGRLRCDRIRPSCTQCKRKCIICFGYRNISLLLFKDESDSTARKVQWERNGAFHHPSFQEKRLDHELPVAPNCNALDTVPSPSCVITPSREELAVTYFMSTYVPASPFEYLPDLYKTVQSAAHDTVTPAVLAASFASLSLQVGSGKLMNEARMHYSDALNRTNAALASSDTATLDSSLISVLVLGLFEAIAFSGHQSPTSWTAHTLGAVQLIQLRGTTKLRTNLDKRLFLQTCNNIRSSCIQRSVPVPDEFLQIYEKAKPFLEPSTPIVRLGPLVDKIASLKWRIQNLPVQMIPIIIDEALQLDEEARRLEDMLPDDWRYQVLPPHMTPKCAYQGVAHKYPAHRVARHWNVLRISRLLFNQVVWRFAEFIAKSRREGLPDILRYCGDLDTDTLQTVAMANCIHLITNVLASVSQFLDKDGRTFVPAARFLIWSLTIVTEIKNTPESARQYAIGCLYDIAMQAKIPQALQAAKAIESGSATDW